MALIRLIRMRADRRGLGVGRWGWWRAIPILSLRLGRSVPRGPVDGGTYDTLGWGEIWDLARHA